MADQNQVARLLYVVKEQMAEIDRLRAENDKLTAVIEGNADTLAYLRTVIWDEQQSVANRIKAAAVALPFERAKPASVAVVVDFREPRELPLKPARCGRLSTSRSPGTGLTVFRFPSTFACRGLRIVTDFIRRPLVLA